MFRQLCLLVVLVCGLGVASADDVKPITAKYRSEDGRIAVEFSGPADVLIDFDKFGRSYINPKWREDEFQMENHIVQVEQASKRGAIMFRLTPIDDADSGKVARSNIRMQKIINAYKGKIIWVNPLPGPRPETTE